MFRLITRLLTPSARPAARTALRLDLLEARDCPAAGVSGFFHSLPWGVGTPPAWQAGPVQVKVQDPDSGPVEVAAREAARRTQGNNNLKQTGIVLPNTPTTLPDGVAAGRGFGQWVMPVKVG
jgi:hypothetical protein